MFVLSVKAEKKRLLIGLAAALLAITLLVVAFSLQGNGTPDIPGETNDQRIVFLQQYGWEVEDEPIDVQEVILPEEFNDVYTNYNAVQKHKTWTWSPSPAKPASNGSTMSRITQGGKTCGLLYWSVRAISSAGT